MEIFFFLLKRCGSNQRVILQVLSEQSAVVKGVFGFAGHCVHRPFIHLVLYGSKKHVQTLPRRVLMNSRLKDDCNH